MITFCSHLPNNKLNVDQNNILHNYHQKQIVKYSSEILKTVSRIMHQITDHF